MAFHSASASRTLPAEQDVFALDVLFVIQQLLLAAHVANTVAEALGGAVFSDGYRVVGSEAFHFRHQVHVRRPQLQRQRAGVAGLLVVVQTLVNILQNEELLDVGLGGLGVGTK